jgi:hypothetical protein
MKNKIINSLLIAIGTSCLLAGCKDSDYDFDKIDYTLGFGSERLSLPDGNSTAEIILDDLLDIDGTDLISSTETGDYVFGKDPSSVSPEIVKVNPITLLNRRHDGSSVTLPVPQSVQALTGQELDVTALGMETSGRIAVFDYSFRSPEAIRSLEHIGISDDQQGTDVTLQLTMPAAVLSFAYIEIDLPDNLELTPPAQDANTTFDASRNVLRITDWSSTGNANRLTQTFRLTGVKTGRLSDDDYALLQDGYFQLKGTVGLSAKVARLRVPATSEVQLAGTIDLGNLNITSARGVFDPDINLNTAGDVSITSLPDFLTDEKVVADIDNPQIWLTLHSTIPLNATLNVLLRSDTYPSGITFDTPGRSINLKASADGASETDTKVLFCRYNPGVDPGEYQVIEDENLSKLVTTLREGMKVEFVVTEAKAVQETGTVLLGHDYHVTPEYRFTAPLAFGPNAVIVYNKNFDGWNKDIDKLTLTPGAYIHMKGNAVNQIPADLEAEVTPIDVNGQPLNDVKVELIQKDIRGTATGTAVSPLELKLKDLSGEGIKKLDGVALKMKAASNEQLRGVTLNKTKQTLILKDISIELTGKVAYDAN